MPYGVGGNMTLGELIKRLEMEPPKKVIRSGFGSPHSYRGFYEDLAFVPMQEGISVEVILKMAKDALGKTFQGYKGGDFKMDENTDVWLAEYGGLGEALTPHSLECILNHG